ncbi:MAG TPA: ABC transporter ATP-binding protein [Candidatus Dormibacteraeota bacterium]|jgi:NitT/TauT family transport system ATP-binding protein|nr:ABC transporter ATP-binding protein [Candidatus Dormibacteraeota bacterium]
MNLSRRRAAPAPVDQSVTVRLDELSKVFGNRDQAVLALDGLSLEVARGEFLCVLGASGCGKSTLLSIIAGLEKPSAGRLEVNSARPAMMFQEPALMPWLTVSRNVDLPMRLAGVPPQARQQRIAELLGVVHLDGFANHRPHELSGGMRQRVALARALAQGGELLLLDEPFAALDAITRDLLHEDLVRIWQESGLTIIFVTHNVREAVRLGDRVVLLSSRPGRVVNQWNVDIPRPRLIETPEVGTLSQEITGHLRKEIRRHSRD